MLGNGALLDLCSRRVIALRDVHAHPFRVTAWAFRVTAWAVSNRMGRGLVIRALGMAVGLWQPPEACSHHADRLSPVSRKTVAGQGDRNIVPTPISAACQSTASRAPLSRM